MGRGGQFVVGAGVVGANDVGPLTGCFVGKGVIVDSPVGGIVGDKLGNSLVLFWAVGSGMIVCTTVGESVSFRVLGT